jgi:hypothetical protein
MADIAQDFDALVRTLRELYDHESNYPEYEILSSAQAKIEQIGYDNWDGGTDIYGLYLEVPTNVYSTYEPHLKTIEESISEKLRPILRKYPRTWIGEVVISPRLVSATSQPPKAYLVPDKKLIEAVEAQRNLMISVSTGGPRIQSVNNDYKERQELIESGLAERGVENPNPYSDLWEWYGKWSSGDLPSYQSRRNYITGLFGPLVKELKRGGQIQTQGLFTRATGWTRVDRNVGEMRSRLAQAKTEEQFQAVGLLCRETLISLAQTVYNADAHPSLDGVTPSKTDAKRMLDAYLATKLPGKTNEAARRHAKSSLDFANEVTHKRTADFREAAMCAEATTAVVNLIAIISGQRDAQE